MSFHKFVRAIRIGPAVFRAVVRYSLAAKRDSGKGILVQILEIIFLRLAKGKIYPDEYYSFNLYDDRRFSWKEKTKFFGSRMDNDLVGILKMQSWAAVANDKLINYSILEHHGLPIPNMLAVIHAYRQYHSLPILGDSWSLENFIRSELSGPFVAKPIQGSFSRGVLAVRSFDAQKENVILGDGTEISIRHFSNIIFSKVEHSDDRAGGFLLQELLRPHRNIEAKCGARICGVRIVVILRHDGPKILFGLWKVATGKNMADNYWRKDNMIALVNAQTGRIGRLVAGKGRDYRCVTHHPDTKESLVDFDLPDWGAAVSTCLSAATLFPGLPMQGWDIALTQNGPVILELNPIGSTDLPQLATEKGIYDGAFREFLSDFAFPMLGTWVIKSSSD